MLVKSYIYIYIYIFIMCSQLHPGTLSPSWAVTLCLPLQSFHHCQTSSVTATPSCNESSERVDERVGV